MILLSELIALFGDELLSRYAGKLLPGHKRALAAMENCRTSASPVRLSACQQQSPYPIDTVLVPGR